ncbi:hypothetical protein [Neobacillus drentensis]|uniref:hypothetical protein n=1 Tax=Neobacillus drentensis TaxID=220684 RepID=UPI00300052F5
MIGAEGAKTPAGVRRRGGSPARPRTARAWSGNQHSSFNRISKSKNYERMCQYA